MISRIETLQRNMEEQSIDFAILMHPRDIYYYAGTAQPSNLLIGRTGEPCLQVRRAWDFVVEETTLPHSCLLADGGFSAMVEIIENTPYPVKSIGLSTDVVPARLFQKIQETFPQCTIKNISPAILAQKMIKDEQELVSLKKAIQLYRFAHQAIMDNLRPGITELELATFIGKAIREQEGEHVIRNRRWDASLHPDGIIAAGANAWRISGSAMTVTGIGLSPSLAWGPSTTEIQKGDLVVVDMPLNLHGYHGDVARTYVAGKATPRQREVFDIVLELQETAFAQLKPGVLAEDVFIATRRKAEELKVDEYFQGYGDMQGSYIGHGLGLEIDETPTLQLGDKTPLQPNMVLAIEPKLIIPQWGAVDLEDDIIITDTGYELIDTVPRQLFEVD